MIRQMLLIRLVTLSLVVAGWPVSAASAQPAPASLPSHFAFGLGGGQGDAWMPQSGIPWDFRMQYLAGGVNTGHGWETWNPNGTFALNYAQESAQHGYIPVLPYYELLQSNGSCGNCNENKKDISNLNDNGVMRAYYANFALLMKRLGTGNYDGIQGYGKLVLVNVEPDFVGGYAVQAVNNGTCFGFCTGRGNDPRLLEASVNSSGFADVAGIPDTYAGFTRALAHLRDLYAPNVQLGFDVSSWATGTDIGLDTNPNTDAAGLGREVGTFFSQLGAHEVLFNDPLDRDAGQYKVQFGQNRWWDRLNVTFPNFSRWEQYLNATLTADDSKPMLLWQVPAGNQYFQSEDNTNGHFQDNRAEYIFGHIPELIQAGIVGAIFAPGNAGSTGWGDTMKDGVTNPPSICTTDGISSRQICNNHPSNVSDDDGGYLRMMGQAYYQNPVTLSGVAAPAPAPAAPQATTPLQVTLGAAGIDADTASSGQDVLVHQDISLNTNVTVLVDFELYNAAGDKVWQVAHDNMALSEGQSTDTAVFTVPDSLAPGAYVFKSGVFSAGWGTLYAWNDQAGTLTVD
jgi:hypothetical protein